MGSVNLGSVGYTARKFAELTSSSSSKNSVCWPRSLDWAETMNLVELYSCVGVEEIISVFLYAILRYMFINV